jgi:two-component system OmpR family response regulator
MAGAVRIECEVAGLPDALARRGIAIDAGAAAVLTDRHVLLTGTGRVVLLVDHLADIARALDAGAADAVLRTSSPDEIAARIAARLRLAAPPIGIGDLLIDRLSRSVTRAGRRLRLLPREYALLVHLAQHAGHAVPRSALLQAVWGLSFDPGTNVVAVHISRLRAKLDHGFAGAMLHTEKGIGYRLVAA